MSSSRFPDAMRWIVLAAFASYAVFLWWNASIQPGGSDQSGYFNLARALHTGQLHLPTRALATLPPQELPDYAYSPLGLRPTGDDRTLTPTYPIGLPMFFAASAAPFGWQLGPHLVMVIHSLAGLWLVYALARQAGASLGGSLFGAATLAVSPLYVQFSVQAMSDVPALVWCALALWLAGRGSVLSALLAGGSMGIAVLIRPSNALVALPVAFALGMSWRRWVALLAGGAPCAMLFCLYNQVAYGQLLTTGYGDVSTLFSVQWVPATLGHYARWLPVVLSPLVVLSLALPLRWTGHARAVIVHGAWIAILLAFYVFYYHTHELWWYLRFVLPVFPSLIVAMILVGESWLERASRHTRIVAFVLSALVVGVNGYAWSRHFAVRFTGQGERIYLAGIQFARENVPANGVIFAMQASGALFYGVPHSIIRWDMIENTWPKIRTATHQAGRPVYALLFDFEAPLAFGHNLPAGNHWVKVQEARNLVLWRLDESSLPR